MNIAFTLVLNGMPFIRQQAEIIPAVFDKWYIIEGATMPSKDTSWCRPIPTKYHDEQFLSVDGTREFLDSIASDKIVIVRNQGKPWDGKVDMCNSFMSELPGKYNLLQVDVDEIWDPNTLRAMLQFADGIESNASFCFKCNYFVGPNIKIISSNTYGDNHYEWYRFWRIVQPNVKWVAHEPPTLGAAFTVLGKSFTTYKGWLFDHYAYTLEQQVAFKEDFYGYAGAVDSWKKLQSHTSFPCYLRDHLPWVRDAAIIDKI